MLLRAGSLDLAVEGDTMIESTQQKIEEVKRRLAGMSADERAESIKMAIAHAVPYVGAPHSLSGHGHGLGESVKANGHDLIVVEEQILRCGNGETCVDFAVDAAGYVVAIESRMR